METLVRLRKLAGTVKGEQNLALGPMQIAAILLEKAVEDACRKEEEDDLKTGT